MANRLLIDDVAGYFNWLSDQTIAEPVALAKEHYAVATILAQYHHQTKEHQIRIEDASAMARHILSITDLEELITASDEVLERLNGLAQSKPVYPTQQLRSHVRRINQLLDDPALVPLMPSVQEIGELRVLLKTSPVNEPMSAANWSWLRTQLPGF
jgi:thioester reductase-like protein